MFEPPSAGLKIETLEFVSQPDGNMVKIEIEDEGEGFNPEEVPDPTLEENLDKPSGRGILLMRAFMDTIEYNDKGNRLRIEKSCSIQG